MKAYCPQKSCSLPPLTHEYKPLSSVYLFAFRAETLETQWLTRARCHWSVVSLASASLTGDPSLDR